MAITFKSKRSANILMLDAAAIPLIKMMGHSGTVPGSLAAEDTAGALEKLRHSIETTGAKLSRLPGDDTNGEESSESAVPLAHRALPLIEMLETAESNGDYVIWDH